MNSFSRASDIKSTVRLSKLNSPYSSDLPPVDGPKLGPFRFPTRISKIEWLERLGITDGSESEHGYIFHIKIEQRHYAIKVVSPRIKILLLFSLVVFNLYLYEQN